MPVQNVLELDDFKQAASSTYIDADTYIPFISQIASKGDPTEHSPAAMDRAMKVFNSWIVRVPTPVGKYHARNNCELIHFRNTEEQQQYQRAWDRYVEAATKAQRDPAHGAMMKLVAMGQFRKAADVIRSYSMAEKLRDAVASGHAGIGVYCFRPAIAKTVRVLVQQFGFKREDISLIWGGDDAFDPSKRLTTEQILTTLGKLATGEDIPRKVMKQIESQLAETEEDTKIIEESRELDLKLGSQSRKERQREIDRFQSGKSKICLFTFSAGGVGLSLHHTDKDEKGNPVENKPRRVFLAPTWSAQDFVQGLGRGHRSIFSLSDTEQTILFYAGTIEEYVMKKVSVKLRCLSKVVRAKESWHDAIWDAAHVKEEERESVITKGDLNDKPETTEARLEDLERDDEEDEES